MPVPPLTSTKSKEEIVGPTAVPAATDSHASATTYARLSLFAGRVFSGWELRDKVVRPVFVNLLTAGIIGGWVWFFSADIHRWLFPPPSAADWPIYCVVEPAVNYSPEAALEADLYIINLEAQSHDSQTLVTRAETYSSDPSARPPTTITIRITGGSYHQILAVDADLPFNDGKGRLQVSKDDNLQRWMVTIGQIEKGAVLRARIRTDARRPITSKSDLETMPFELLYARRLR
jgi:hypothetical protein